MFPCEKQDGFPVCVDSVPRVPCAVKKNNGNIADISIILHESAIPSANSVVSPDSVISVKVNFPLPPGNGGNVPISPAKNYVIFQQQQQAAKSTESAKSSPLRNSGFVPSYLACQEFQSVRRPSVRHNEGKVVREEFYGNDVLSYQLPETIVPVAVSWYKQKLKASGNVVKVREYEILQQRGGEKVKSDKPLKERTPAEIAKQDKFNANRARDKIIDILNSNFGMRSRVDCEGNKSVKFLTLTYKKNEKNLDRVYNDFSLFLKRMEYALKDKVVYLTVPEKQERGAWHIHTMLYSKYVPFQWLLDNWNETRGQGSFKINEVKDVGNLGKYVAKYVSKTFMEGGVLPGRKRYWHSEGLKDKSTVVYTRQSPFRLLDYVDYFDGFIASGKAGKPAVRMGNYGEGNEYTGRVDFLDLTLKPCRDVKYLLKTLEWWVSTVTPVHS